MNSLKMEVKGGEAVDRSGDLYAIQHRTLAELSNSMSCYTSSRL